jgi:hypothetical protein
VPDPLTPGAETCVEGDEADGGKEKSPAHGDSGLASHAAGVELAGQDEPREREAATRHEGVVSPPDHEPGCAEKGQADRGRDPPVGEHGREGGHERRHESGDPEGFQPGASRTVEHCG